MTRDELVHQIRKKQSFLCVGLDPVLEKIPAHLRNFEDPIFEFNKRIIDATAPFAVAFKPNTAFYEAQGVKGWESLEKTIRYIPKDCFIIADAKGRYWKYFHGICQNILRGFTLRCRYGGAVHGEG